MKTVCGRVLCVRMCVREKERESRCVCVYEGLRRLAPISVDTSHGMAW